MKEAFRMADDMIAETIRNMTRILAEPAMINLDFADMKTIMTIQGESVLSFGEGRGKNKAMNAVDACLSSVLLKDRTIKGAKGLLLSIVGGDDLGMHEVNNTLKKFTQTIHPDANIIFGANIDPSYKERVHVTMIATGIDPFASELEKMDIEELAREDIPAVVRATGKMDFGPDTLFGQQKPMEDLDIPACMRKRKRLQGNELYSKED
jgi:cell division protein FtsZ